MTLWHTRRRCGGLLPGAGIPQGKGQTTAAWSLHVGAVGDRSTPHQTRSGGGKPSVASRPFSRTTREVLMAYSLSVYRTSLFRKTIQRTTDAQVARLLVVSLQG